MTTKYLTSEQEAAREEAIQAGYYEEGKIRSVSPYRDGSGMYSVDLEGGTGCGISVPSDFTAPQVGDILRIYTQGLGSRIFGWDLMGVPLVFRTLFGIQADDRKAEVERRARKMEQWEKDKPRLFRAWDDLPAPLFARVRRFATNCPEGFDHWWANYGGYELAGLSAAVAIYEAVKECDDPDGAILYFSELDWNERVALVPGCEQADSGNLAGYAVSVAATLASDSDDRDYILEWGHGAMTPLTGCEDYGCVTPAEAERRAP